MADHPNMPIGTAAINWFDSSGNLHIRIYASDGYNVTERCSDQGTEGWTTGAFSQPGSQVSAMLWMTKEGPNLRVYCTFEDNVTEWCNNAGGSGWFQGTYTVA